MTLTVHGTNALSGTVRRAITYHRPPESWTLDDLKKVLAKAFDAIGIPMRGCHYTLTRHPEGSVEVYASWGMGARGNAVVRMDWLKAMPAAVFAALARDRQYVLTIQGTLMTRRRAPRQIEGRYDRATRGLMGGEA